MPSAMETKALEATRNRFYEVFEPHCKWNTLEILDIELKGFKREHLKVQTNNNKGFLLIHGERPLSATKWTRFCKKIKLSEDSNLSEIRAKFSDGVLSIVVPRQVKEAGRENVDEAVVEGCKTDYDLTVRITKSWAMKAAVFVVAVVTAVAVVTQIAPPPPVNRHPIPVLNDVAATEDVFVDRAVEESNRARPSFNMFKNRPK